RRTRRQPAAGRTRRTQPPPTSTPGSEPDSGAARVCSGKPSYAAASRAATRSTGSGSAPQCRTWSTTVDLLGGGVGADDQPPVACGQHPVRHVDAEPGPALEHLADVLRAQVQPAG